MEEKESNELKRFDIEGALFLIYAAAGVVVLAARNEWPNDVEGWIVEGPMEFYIPVAVVVVGYLHFKRRIWPRTPD
jgi:hypothetical protein